MNRSNAGANTNTAQMIFDISILLLAFLLDILFFSKMLAEESYYKFIMLVFVFILVFLLSSKEEYLYNVTMFCYLDRVHSKINKSFLLAVAATAALMNYITDTKEGRKFYILYLIFAYTLVCIKMFFNKKISKEFNKKNRLRTAFIGEISSFKKFQEFMEKTSIHVNLIGYIAWDQQMALEREGCYIGHLEELESLIRTHNLDQIYLLQNENYDSEMECRYIELCMDMGVTVRVIVNYYQQRRTDSYVSTVGTYPVLTYHTVSLNTYEQVMKRLLDILGGICGIIIFMPVMLITAIAIKLDSPGGVLFKQVRIGQNGRRFCMYKFRSMNMNAEKQKESLMKKNEIEGGVMFKMKEDPRITKVGRIIRKYSIDELPQFFNVVKGDMSLVGTRPPTIDEVDKYKRTQWRRISIKPGITGMWQVSGRSDVQSFDDIVKMDIDYIDRWTLLLDIKIILRTVLVLLRHKGSY
ncbi:sugar transferase [Lachnospiraceae bacterium OttesenSCG-928-D06]|nr:sugar transferase [Lachnospiraceae bacterium OttesenSCG-928-D06]